MPAAVFDGTPTNPTEEAVAAALALYRAEGCDGVIGLGGGSPIDLAKGVALLATHAGPLANYAAILGGIPKITAAIAPVIAIPTTAGTGSEVGRAALITLSDGRKLGFISPHLIPKARDLRPRADPRPAAPAHRRHRHGRAHPLRRDLPLAALQPAGRGDRPGRPGARAASWIERAVADGTTATPASEMMMAALEGGLTFQKGLGAVHALSHPLGGLKEPSLHHGTLNAVLLPAVLRFNAPHAEEKYRVLRRVLNLPEDASLPEYFAELTARLGLPTSLRQMGVPGACLPDIARNATLDHSAATNPQPVERSGVPWPAQRSDGRLSSARYNSCSSCCTLGSTWSANGASTCAGMAPVSTAMARAQPALRAISRSAGVSPTTITSSGRRPWAAQKASAMPGPGFSPWPASAPMTKSSWLAMPRWPVWAWAMAVSSMVATPSFRPRARRRPSRAGRSPTGRGG